MSKVDKLGVYKDIIIAKFGGNYQVSGSEMIYHCPYCPDQSKFGDKLYVNSKLGVYNCFRCGAHGKISLDSDSQSISSSVEDAVTTVSEFLKIKPVRNIEELYVEIPSARLVNYPQSYAYQYILNRGISKDQMDYYDLRVFGTSPEFHNRVVFPNRVVNYNWTDFWTARAMFDQIPKYLNSNLVSKSEIVFNLYRIPENSDIIINEGIINSIIAGPNSVAILGKSCSFSQFKQIVYKKPKSVIISLDTDAIEWSLNLAKKFKEVGVPVRITYLPDNKDASELGYPRYMEYVNSSKEVNQKEEIISGILDFIGG